ncbi:hypothetical protein Tco_0867405, partial [Tanacetum coccineum]
VPCPKHADHEIVAEVHPYAEDASHTAQSPDYVPESDPEADPEEDDDEDPKEDLLDYLADGGDEGDDEDEPSEVDEEDDVDIEAHKDEEEEEHPAPADFVVVALPATDQASSAEETESFETERSAATPPPHPAYRVTARISIPAPIPTPVWFDAEVARLLAILPPIITLLPWSFTTSSDTLSPPLPSDYHLHHYSTPPLPAINNQTIWLGSTMDRRSGVIRKERCQILESCMLADRWRAGCDLRDAEGGPYRRSAEIERVGTDGSYPQQQLIRHCQDSRDPPGGPAQPELPEEAGSSS